MGLIINTKFPIKLIGDKVYQRDFKRISDPLTKFGARFKLKNKKNLPLTIFGSSQLKPIKYFETRGSAQCKSAVIFGGMRTQGTTIIKAKKSRNHTEIMSKHLNLPLICKKRKDYDEIKIKKIKNFKTLNYNIPSDISSSAFFIALTALTKDSKLIIKNVNINLSRIGIIKILKKMGVKINFKNQKIYKGEKIADIIIESPKKIKAINCPKKYNSGAIDEFLVIFLVAGKQGVSFFTGLAELNPKRKPKTKMGFKNFKQAWHKKYNYKDTIKIFGNPQVNVNKKIVIKNYLRP